MEESVVGIWNNKEYHLRGECSVYSDPYPWSGFQVCQFNNPSDYDDFHLQDFNPFGGVCGTQWTSYFQVPMVISACCYAGSV